MPGYQEHPPEHMKMPPMPEYAIVGQAQGFCEIKDCGHVAATKVYLTIKAEWESGRDLMGRIRQALRVCETHFEHLVDGVALEAQGRPIEQ